MKAPGDRHPNWSDEDYNDLVSFDRHRIQPPGMVYVTVDDIFVLKVLSPSITATVNVTLRFLQANGNIIPTFQQFPNLAAQSTPLAIKFRGAEGYLLSATISTPGASGGAVYVQLELARGAGSGDVTEGHLLIGGYPGSFAALGYPQTQPVPPNASFGFTRSVTISNPAAGANWSITVPAGAAWVLLSARATLATSVTVASRVPDLRVQDGSGNTLLDAQAGVAQTASLTDAWNWAPGNVTATVLSAVNLVALPTAFRLNAGWVIQQVTTGLQAADQWSAIALSVTETVAA
jgi:hypothetical protein